jgi:hypothetical protein
VTGEKVGENRVRQLGDPLCRHSWDIRPVTEQWAVAFCYRCHEVRDVVVREVES